MLNGRYFYGWNIVLAAIVIGFLTTGLGGFANGILLPHLADELTGGSRGQVSVAFSVGTVCAALAAPFIGRYADIHSPKRVMIFGSLVMCGGYIVLANATQYWHLVLGKGAMYGVSIAMVGPLVRSKIVAQWFTRIRGRALGFSVMGASIAGVTLPLILSNMVSELGWRTTVYLFAIVIALVLLPTIAFVMRDKPQDMGLMPDGDRADEAAERAEGVAGQPDLAADERTWTWAQMLKSRALWATGLTFGPMICVYIVIVVHLFGHAIESGLSETQAALIISIFSIAAIVFKPMVGMMADAVGARITLWTSLIVQAAALAGFAYADSVATFGITAVVHGFGYSAFSSMRTFALAEAFGVRSLGSAVGLLSWIELPFAVLASPIAGFMFDATGSYDNAFLIFSGFLVFGCIGPFLLKASKDEPHEVSSGKA